MKEKEKYKAEMESRLLRCGEILNEIKMKQNEVNEIPPGCDINSIADKYKKAKADLGEVDQIDENSWEKFKGKLDGLTDDIDEDLRKALAYF